MFMPWSLVLVGISTWCLRRRFEAARAGADSHTTECYFWGFFKSTSHFPSRLQCAYTALACIWDCGSGLDYGKPEFENSQQWNLEEKLYEWKTTIERNNLLKNTQSWHVATNFTPPLYVAEEHPHTLNTWTASWGESFWLLPREFHI